MTYEFCKLLIEKKMYVEAEILEKLDLFYLHNRITGEQYEELIALIE